jgi:2-keto-4-pentenoate hydratase/2-oxohepta-3-ene-1,7-dioic acid hydratase in catechol pathway
MVLPAGAPERVDYEGEMAVVIGRAASDVEAADAWSYVAGRDRRERCDRPRRPGGGLPTMDVTIAKAFPSFKPLGPGLIAGNETRGTLSIRTTVNGEMRQQARTDDLIFAISDVVATPTVSLAKLRRIQAT